MKKLLLFVVLICYNNFYSQCADPSITDFECTPASYAFTGNLTSIANPFSSGINTSATVGQYTGDGTAGFDNLTFDNGSSINLATNNVFKFKVYSTKVVPLVAKLEGGTSAGVEIPLTVDITGAWIEYTVDFSSRSAENHNKIVLFFNFNRTDGTASDVYYIDDIRWEASSSSTLPTVTNFESTKPAVGSYPAKLLTVSNHVPSGINTSNTIGQYTDDGTNGFDGLIFNYGSAIDLSTNNILKIKLYSTRSIQILAKLEGGSSAREIYSDFSGTVGSLNSWVELKFDFSAFANNSTGGDGNTRIVLFVNAAVSTGAAEEIHYLDDIVWAPTSTWTGAADSNWTNAGNWTGGVPTSNSQVSISNVGASPIIGNASDTSVEVNNLVVDNAATLTVKNGSTLLVNGISEGNVTYTRNITTPAATGTTAVDNLEGWHLMASPVLGQVITTTWADANGIASGTASNRGIATYNNAVASGNWNYFSGTTSTFATGSGYSIKRTVTGDVSFTGTLSTVDISNIAISTNTTSFNLVGNPFLAYLKSSLILTTNTNLLDSQTIWIWNPSTKNYETKVTGDDFKIAPGQGFFVKAASAGNIKMPKAAQESGTDTFLKSSSKPEIVINITNGNLERFTKIRYNDNSTTDFDNGFDGELFTGSSNDLTIYSKLVSNTSDKKYQIQSLPNNGLEDMVVPLEFYSKVDNKLTLTADVNGLAENYKVYLEDKVFDTFTRLDESDSEIELDITRGQTNGRFFVHTTANVLSVNDNNISNISLFKSNNNLIIRGLQNAKTDVSIFNTLGVKVSKTSFIASLNYSMNLPKLPTGIYIVTVTSGQIELNKKIIIE